MDPAYYIAVEAELNVLIMLGQSSVFGHMDHVPVAYMSYFYAENDYLLTYHKRKDRRSAK